MEIKPAGLEGMPWVAERNFGTGTVLANEGGRTVLTPGGGDLRKAFEKLDDTAGTLADSPVLNRAVSAAGRGGDFVESLLSGDLSVRLADLIQQQGQASPASQAARQVMTQAASAERFIRGLTGENFAAGVGRLPELLSKAGALREAAATLAGGANFFRGLASGELLGGVLAYREQLQALSKALRSFDLLEGFEHHAASMLEQRDLSRMLVMDFARVQQERHEAGADLAGAVQARLLR